MNASVATLLVAVLHVAFAAAESVGWAAFARRLGYDDARIAATKPLALNQGAYNFGVAAMLVWAVATGSWPAAQVLLLFIVAMSVVGALSVRWTIFAIQGLPALAALAFTLG
jgi:putative membrane protein